MIRTMFVSVCLSLLAVRSIVAGDVGELIQLLPSDANAIAIVHVHDLLQTPRAQQEQWGERADERFLSGAGGIPSWVSDLVVGSLVRPGAAEEVWSATVARVPTGSFAELVHQNGAEPELIGKHRVSYTRRNALAAELTADVIGVRAPAARQELARWLSAIDRQRTGDLDPYLAQAAQRPGQLILAIELAHVLDPGRVAAHVQSLAGATPNDPVPNALIQWMNSLAGVTLAVFVEQEIVSQVTLDFSVNSPLTDPTDQVALAQLARQLFTSAVGQAGLGLDELDEATAVAGERAVTLSFPLSEDSLRRIVTLITSTPLEAPQSAPAVVAPAPAVNPGAAAPRNPAPRVEINRPAPRPAEPADPVARMGQASRRYFDAVNRLIADLERANRRANNYERTATWHENYARRILDLPTRDVDPALVQYGSEAANQLRGLARSLRGQALEVNVQQGTLTYQTHYTPGWASVNLWGGVGYGEAAYNVTSNLAEVRQRQAQAVLAGSQQREQIWTMLANTRDQVQQDMRAKYPENF